MMTSSGSASSSTRGRSSVFPSTLSPAIRMPRLRGSSSMKPIGTPRARRCAAARAPRAARRCRRPPRAPPARRGRAAAPGRSMSARTSEAAAPHEQQREQEVERDHAARRVRRRRVRSRRARTRGRRLDDRDRPPDRPAVAPVHEAPAACGRARTGRRPAPCRPPRARSSRRGAARSAPGSRRRSAGEREAVGERHEARRRWRSAPGAGGHRRVEARAQDATIARVGAEQETGQLARVAPDRAPRRALALRRPRCRRGSTGAAASPPRSAARPPRRAAPRTACETGVPSATASRFIVPPAETTRSARATRLCASIARSGTTTPPKRRDLRALLGRAREHHRLGLLAQPLEHPREQRVLEAVVERHLGRRAHDGDGPRRIEPQLPEHGRVGLEVRQVVLLLQPRVAAQLPARAVGVEPLRRDRLGHHHGAREAAVHGVLDARPLVVEGRHARHAERARRHASRRWSRARARGRSARAAAPSARGRASARPARRPSPRCARPRWRPTAVWAMPKRPSSSSVCAKSRAVTSTSCPSARIAADQRAHHEHVGRVRQVDPDAHARTTSVRPARGSAPGPWAGRGACARPRRCPAGRARPREGRHRRLAVERAAVVAARRRRPRARARRQRVRVADGARRRGDRRARRRAPAAGRVASARGPAPRRARPRRGGGRSSASSSGRSTRSTRGLERVQPRVVAHLEEGAACRRSRGSAGGRARAATAASSVTIAPPSPRQGRFLEGKNENVAAWPSAPARRPSRRAPGGLRGVLEHRQAEPPQLGHGRDVAEQVHGHDRPRARVRARSTVSAVTQKVSGSTSQNTGRAPAFTTASAVA